ncbi:MAG: hypothetical protein M1820_004211 [Bogoriella megaspora]|nr:MAG: hypothetical protein M1820_004211 [Bogoriella megaspora]
MGKARPIPVIIGVGDFKNKSLDTDAPLEPLQLILRTISNALEDTQLESVALEKLQSQIDSVDIVKTWTWPYPDLPGLLSEKLRILPTHQHYSDHGGNQPAKLLDDAARRISLGQSRVALIAGGEALASLSACAAAQKLPPPGWTQIGESPDFVFSPTTRALGSSTLLEQARPSTFTHGNEGLGALHDIGNPIHIYPLYENALRAHRGQSIEENNKESAELYAQFAEVAAQQPYAWNYRKKPSNAEDIGLTHLTEIGKLLTIREDPLLMNAFNVINLAAACILTTTDYAREIGISQDRWIYPVGGAGTRDSNDFWKRPDYQSSPSISRSLDAGLTNSGLRKEDIDLFDFYSCFPVVPKIACRHLGLPILSSSKPITLLGGLTSFGGAGNNYSMHAITELVRRLRAGKGRNGLVLANGGVVTYQNVICLSTRPRRDELPYANQNVLTEVITDVPVPEIESNPEGEGSIETYTVEYKRDNTPLRAYIIGRISGSGHRFLANHGDAATLNFLAEGRKEPIGCRGSIRSDDERPGRSLFTLVDVGSKL